MRVDEIGADHFVLGVFQNALEIGLAGLFHRRGNFRVAGVLGGADGQIHARGTVGTGTRNDMPVNLPLTSGQTRPTALAAPVVEG